MLPAMTISYTSARPATGMARALPWAAPLVAAFGPAAVFAADLSLTVEVPRLDVAEYHRPYVAIWIEKPDQSFAGNLAVWYDLKMRNKEGTKWLKDMRSWWRKSGRELDMPVDGISGATRAPGAHTVSFGDNSVLKSLPAGEYQLVIEAAREVGGRELLRLPFVWPAKPGAKAISSEARGETELGAVSVTVKP
ncbi:putative signal peptide protein [Hylemonella gracilis ATCC 19624]|uniref:Putative signal peptide protein n=2 Tax=Hylemonella gracilis TaxID=80880 RepID=F3KSL7_9BURK|nr:putative signal peptide protein [Hylemonella gracilis ATCC 19624]